MTDPEFTEGQRAVVKLMVHDVGEEFVTRMTEQVDRVVASQVIACRLEREARFTALREDAQEKARTLLRDSGLLHHTAAALWVDRLWKICMILLTITLTTLVGWLVSNGK